MTIYSKTITTSTKLPDSDGDGQVKLGAANATKYGVPTGTVVVFVEKAAGGYLYGVQGTEIPDGPSPLDLCNTEVSRLALVVADLTSANGVLTAENADLTATNAALTTENAALREQIAQGPASPPIPVKTAQRNGVSLSNSRNGYYETVPEYVAPYVERGGIRALRIPVKRSLLFQDGEIKDLITLNGYPTYAWQDPKGLKQVGLKSIIDYCLAKDVSPMIDDHVFSSYGNAELIPFWVAMGKKLMETYGDNDLIRLELQNEAASGGWPVDYAQTVKTLVEAIRAAGITYTLVVGWGGWNSVGGYKRALAELDAVGGAEHIDPLGRLEFSAHHYPTTTGNDQPASGKTAPQIKGSELSTTWSEIFDEFKRRGLRIWITEIGMGGGARGWLANGSGTPDFNGKAWFQQFAALVKQYPDTVAGILAWGGGLAWGDTYPFKVEWAKGQWDATAATDFWQSLTGFWKG